MVRVFKPTDGPIVDLLMEPKSFSPIWVFLGGSIEMDTAERWQDKVIQYIQEAFGENEETHVHVLNPRRDKWENSWVQSKTNPMFAEQVNWELEALTAADVTLFYFDPNTKSPVTMLELGSKSGEAGVFVYCPEGFHRKGNVDLFCDFHGIEQADSWEEMLQLLEIEINSVW